MSSLTVSDDNLITFLTELESSYDKQPIVSMALLNQELYDIIDINRSSNISGSNNKIHINNLYKLFKKLHGDEDRIISEFLSLKIAKNIINLFINDKDYLNYPQELFSNTFVNFAINNKLFFKSLSLHTSLETNVFRLLIYKKDSLDYFNFKFNIDHIAMYIIEIKKITQFIKTQLLTYMMLNSYEVNLGINCIILAHKFISDKLLTGDQLTSELRDCAYSLFELLYRGLSNMYHINKAQSRVYKEAYSSSAQSVNNTYLTEINAQLKICEININLLSANDIFTSILNTKICQLTTVKYLEFQSESNNILEAFPYYINKDTYPRDDFDNSFEYFNSIVYDLLNNESVALHNKCEIILFYEYFNSKYIPCLLKILIKINNNSHTIHIQRNKKVNMKIHSIFNKLITKDNSSCLNNDNFITVFSRLVIGTLNNINSCINIFISAQTHYNKIIIIKEVINLNILIRFIMTFYKNVQLNDKSSVFYFKMAEIFYSFFNLSSKGRLHTQTSAYYLNPKTIPVVPKSFSHKVDETLQFIYIFFKMLIDNDTFIDIFTIHKEFYNKTHIRDIQINYGKFIYTSMENRDEFHLNCDITELLETFINKHNELIKTKQSDEVKYKSDIPDKFLDPIMYTPIETPIEIPDVKEIVDKYMIYNHLVFTHTNPFTNKDLTVEELEEYNEKPAVINRLAIFNLEFQEWKLNNKIK